MKYIVANCIATEFEYKAFIKAFDLINNASIPMADNGPLTRIQLAIIKNTNGNLNLLNDNIKLAEIDWRDVLVNAKMENENWTFDTRHQTLDRTNIECFFECKYIQEYQVKMNELLAVYLNGNNRNYGYNPLYHEKRMKRVYRKDYLYAEKSTTTFLSMIKYPIPDWNTEDLQIFGERVQCYLENSFPWIDSIIRQQIMNYVLYGYK